MESHVTDITRVIQLAVAPVFLLTAIATLISTLNNRLGRIVDRRRFLQDRRNPAGSIEAGDGDARELDLLARRANLVYLAILWAVLSALLVCLVVAGAFVGALIVVDLSRAVAAMFVLAMVSLVVTLGMFLREVFLAVASATHVNR